MRKDAFIFMYAEELKHKRMHPVLGAVFVFALVILLIFLMQVVSFLQFWLKVNWIQFILYGFLIFAGYLLVKYYLTEYIYLIEKDRVTFGRRIGKREKELLFIPFREILAFGEYVDFKEKIKGKKVFKLTFQKKHQCFVLDCEGCAVLMSPSDAYKSKLKEIKHRKKQPA